MFFIWIWTFVLGDESDVQIVSPTDLLEPTSNTNDKTKDQEKGNQDHDTTEPTFSSILRSTLAQDKLHMEIVRWPKKRSPQNSLSAERKKRQKELVLQNDAEQKKGLG